MEDKLLKEILEYNLLDITSKFNKKDKIKSIISKFNSIAKNQTAILDESVLITKIIIRRGD